MPSAQLVTESEHDSSSVSTIVRPSPWRAWGYLMVGAVLLAMIATWLVWFSAFIQRKYHEEDIRASCQRVMPETAERCFDTVVIQRGGVRR